MPTDKLDQLFGVEEIKAQQQQVIAIIDDTVAHITAASKQMRASELFVTDSNSLAQGTAAIKAATAAVDAHKASLEKLLAVKQQEQTLADAIAAVTAQSSKNRKDETDGAAALATAISALNKERERLAAQAAQEATNARNLGASYEQLKKQYKDAGDNAKQLAAAQVLAGTATDGFNTKTKDAIGHAQNLGTQLNAAGTQVASYQNKVDACKGVSEQFNNMLGELPKLAQSPGEFIQALSGHIAGFAEQMIKARGEGQDWGNVLTAIGGSITGLPGIINLAVTALGIFSNEINNSKDVLEDFKEIQDKATDAIKKYQDQLSGQADKSEQFRNVAGLDALNRELELLKAKGASLNIIYQKEQQIRQAELYNINVRYETIRYSDADKADELLKQRYDKLNEIEIAKVRFERSKVHGSAKFQHNSSSGVSSKLSQTGVSLPGAPGADSENAPSYITPDIDGLQAKAHAKALKAIADKNKQLYTADEQALIDSLKNKEISYTNYQDEVSKLNERYAKKQVDDVIKYLQQVLDTEQLTADERKKIQKDLDDAREKSTQQANKKIEAEAARSVKMQQKILETLKSAETSIFQIVDAVNKQKNAATDEEIKKIQEKRDADIDAVNTSYTNQEDKARRIAEIKVTADIQEKRLDAEKRLRAQKFAAAEKTANIAEIIGRTALAVVTALSDKTITPAYLRIPFAIGVGLAGAAQLAAAISAPLPQYATGTAHHPGGMFIAGDGGEQELIVPRNKKPYWSNAYSTLYDEGPGTKVIPLHTLPVADYSPTSLPAPSLVPDSNLVLAREIRSYTAALTAGSQSGRSDVDYKLLHGLIRRTVRKGNYTHNDYLHDNS